MAITSTVYFMKTSKIYFKDLKYYNIKNFKLHIYILLKIFHIPNIFQNCISISSMLGSPAFYLIHLMTFAENCPYTGVSDLEQVLLTSWL